MEAYLFFSKLKEKGWIFHQIYEELIHGSRSNVTKGQGKVALLKAKKTYLKEFDGKIVYQIFGMA